MSFEKEASHKVVLTCFAGRERYMSILMKYVDFLYNKGHIHQVHLWDYTKDKDDTKWLHATYGDPVEPGYVVDKTCSLSTWEPVYTATGVYIRPGERVKVRVRGAMNAHVALVTDEQQILCEACLANSHGESILRCDNNMSRYAGLQLRSDTWTDIYVEWRIQEQKIVFYHGTQYILSTDVSWYTKFTGKYLSRLEFRVGSLKTTVFWDFGKAYPVQKQKHPYVSVMKVHEKRCWNEYYRHYTKETYPNHVIIKCDDDIVFIDPDRFKEFTDATMQDSASVMRFPSILNNGVGTYWQQQNGLIPRSLSIFPYDRDHGKLWGNGMLCHLLHEYFIAHHEQWLASSHATATSNTHNYKHPIGDRISINFFAVATPNLDIYQIMHLNENNDELEITCEIPVIVNKPICIDFSMTVSHFGFYRQRETGLNESTLLPKYMELASKILNRR